MPSCTRRFVITLVGSAVVASLHGPLLAQSAAALQSEHLLGTWRLDVAKSRYSPGPAPVSETRTYARDAQGIKGQIIRVFQDGRREVIDYRADFDHDYPVYGASGYDAIRFRRIDERTAESVLSHAGKVWGSARRELSPSGDTLTVTFRRTEPGDMVQNVAIYRKAPK